MGDKGKKDKQKHAKQQNKKHEAKKEAMRKKQEKPVFKKQDYRIIFICIIGQAQGLP